MSIVDEQKKNMIKNLSLPDIYLSDIPSFKFHFSNSEDCDSYGGAQTSSQIKIHNIFLLLQVLLSQVHDKLTSTNSA